MQAEIVWGATGRPAAGNDAPALPPDITSAACWPGACVVATAWLALILYAAGRGLG